MDALRADFRLCRTGDSWGDCMGFWFAVSEELFWHRNVDPPANWRYRPGAATRGPDYDNPALMFLEDASVDGLIRFGDVLDRYSRMLRAAGRNY